MTQTRPQLEFYPDDGSFYIHPSAWMCDEGARPFRADPGDFISADMFNARSTEFRWPAFDDEREFREFVMFVVRMVQIIGLDKSDLTMRRIATLASMEGADNVSLQRVVERLRDMQKAVV
jgi:hypothetical protein